MRLEPESHRWTLDQVTARNAGLPQDSQSVNDPDAATKPSPMRTTVLRNLRPPISERI